MKASKSKEGNNSKLIRRILLFSFFALSFSILIFAVVSAVTLKIPSVEAVFDKAVPVIVTVIVFIISLIMSKSSEKRIFEALCEGIVLSFIVFAVSLTIGSCASVPQMIFRSLAIIAASAIGALASSLSKGGGKKRNKSTARLKKSLKK